MGFLKPGMTPMQGPSEAGSGGKQTPKIAFTITNTHMVFGLESSVERAIRTLSSGGGSPLGSSKWFTSGKSAIPEAVGLASLEDSVTSGELLWWTIKQSGEVNAVTAAGDVVFDFGLPRFDDLVNPALLPAFEVVRKYFGVWASYGISRSDGFFFEFREVSSPVSN